jgi:hypothetical protein
MVFPMRLSLSRSGGFAGVMKPPLVVESDDFAPAAAKQLAQLVERASAAKKNSPAPSGKLNNASPAPPSPMADGFVYELTIKRDRGADDGGTTVLNLSENTMPAAARELIEFLQANAPSKSPRR